MVTLLDAGLLSTLAPILSLLFVMAVVFGVLSMTKLFGDNKGIHILIAVILGLLVLLVPNVNNLIMTMMPWYTFLFIFIVFMLLIYKIFGATDADIVGVLRGDRTIGWLIVIICLIIAGGAMASVYGQQLLPLTTGPAVEGAQGTGTGTVYAGGTTSGAASSATGTYSNNLAAAFFHPKILGFGLIMLIAVFAMAVMSMEPR
ncbi:MAG: hypothetical protein Q7R76_05715 [Candidatus Woesearchaeota archaeon]|nr:hypothetical protein [Candidatus Woesearchaeota archaeon]